MARRVLQAWLGYIVSLPVSFLTSTYACYKGDPTFPLVAVVFSSVVGFLSPEIWKAVKKFAERPKNLVIAGAVILLLYAQFFSPALKTQIAGLALLIGLFWFLYYGFFTKFLGIKTKKKKS